MIKRRKQGGFLRTLLALFGGLIALIVIAALVVSLIKIPINVSSYKGLVESTASDALGRTVKVDGDMTVTTSLWPYFEIQGIRIANPEGFEKGDLASMELARISVELLPLLDRKIQIEAFRVDGLALNLVRNERGDVNWVLTGATAAEAVDAGSETAPPTLASDALAVDELVLENISVTFRDASDQEELEFIMEKAAGSAAYGEPMVLSMNGVLLDEPFTLDVEANSLAEFLAMARSRLEFEIDIADTRFRFAGLSDALGSNRTTELDVAVEGERLDSLDDLLRLDLPPLVDYRLAAHLTASPGRLELTDLEANVKDSALNGTVVVDRTGAKPFATMQLTADTIQLTDFDTGDWSADEPDSESTEPAVEESEPETVRKRAKPLSPETLQRANLKLEIQVAEVLSGEDKLGSGELTLELKDGRLALEPLRLQLPKATLLLEASVKPGAEASDASLRVLIENFDFGVLARLRNPDSEIGGTLNMDIDVTASASNVRNLLTGANGYLDVAGNPENFSSGIVDLWAVNLLSSVVSSSVEDENASQINCLISRWSLEDGRMTAQSLAIDTSKIRICGKGNIDFNDQTFALTASPTAKRPEFFSLATPLAVKGSFDDFRVGMKGGALSLGTTAVKFAISPITTPFKRLVQDDLPADGGDICSLPIGPHDGELDDLPGC